MRNQLSALAGEGSSLYRHHKIYLDPVGVATAPCEYEERLTPLFPGAWTNIELYALEAHDLAWLNSSAMRNVIGTTSFASHGQDILIEKRSTRATSTSFVHISVEKAGAIKP
jgi:hypothetical protein